MDPRLYPLLALGTLVRLDMVVPSLAILGVAMLTDAAKRRQYLAPGAGVLAAALGGETLFRWLYYGDVLPNTFYLKMTGYPAWDRISRGLFVFEQFAVRLVIGLFLLLPGLRLVRRDRRTALLLAVITAQFAYSVYVGRDAWDWSGGSNRYLSIVMPLVFVLLAVGAGALGRARSEQSTIGPGRAHGLLFALVLLTVGSVNAMADSEAWRRWALLVPPMHVPDNATKVRVALQVRNLASDRAVVGMVWAAAQSYFMDRTTIDLLGKSDREIAHGPIHRQPPGTPRWDVVRFFWPGHLKYNSAYSIGRLQPDVLPQTWFDSAEARPYIDHRYREVVLAGTPVLLWAHSPDIAWTRLGVRVPRDRVGPRAPH